MKLDGTKLKGLRERKGWSQTRLGRKCKPSLSVVTICSAENGGNIYPDTALRICTALETDIASLELPTEGNDNAGKNNSRPRSTAKRNLPKSARVA